MAVTIKDVAREAGVSITTVSHALNGYDDVSEKTRALVCEVAARLEYVPNRNSQSLRGYTRPTLAIMLIDGMAERDTDTPGYSVMSGISHVVTEADCDLIILNIPHRIQTEKTFRQICRERMLSGVVVFGLSDGDPYIEQLRDTDIPCVLLDVDIGSGNSHVVTIDNRGAAREAVSYLFGRGYRNIALLNGGDAAQVSELRRQGYRDALTERGCPIREEWEVYCHFLEEEARETAVRLKTQYPQIDAFFCASDEMAIGALNGMAQLGLAVPQEVGVCGFDNIPVSRYIMGGITTVAQYPYESGLRCGEALLELVAGRPVPHRIETGFQLEKRQTTR